MIRCLRKTALGHGYRVTSRQPPQRELSVVVRGRYRLAPGEPVELLRKKVARFEEGVVPEAGQAELEEAELALGQLPLSADVFRDPSPDGGAARALLYPSDWAEFKPRADVIVLATCHPPRPTKECAVSVEVEGRMRKDLVVLGPRVWVDRILGGASTEPLEFESMPIDWEHAFGGPELTSNPVGRGHASKELPNVEHPRARLRDSTQLPPPAGFGPIHPQWSPRREKMGEKWGEEYEKTRAPYYAEDYDWSQQNAAPRDQQLEGYLRGDETLRFRNLVKDHPDFKAKLPGVRPRVFVFHQSVRDAQRTSIVEVPLVLDTVVADLEEGELFLCWRGLTPVEQDDLTDVPFMLIADEAMADAPGDRGAYEEALRAFAADPTGYESSTQLKLQQLQDELDSGALIERIDALPEDQDPAGAIVAPLLGDGKEARSIVDTMNEQMLTTEAKAPGTRAKVKEELKKALRLIADGGGGPAPMQAGGGEAPGAFFKGILQAMSNAQQDTAGKPLPGTNALIERKLAEAGLEGVAPEDLKVPPPQQSSVEPGPGADFRDRDLSDWDFTGADLKGACFDRANLSRARFEGAQLEGASFVGACLGGADLRGVDLRGATLKATILTKTKLAGANLTGAVLQTALVSRADLTGAILDGVDGRAANFHKATLDGARFRQAVLTKAVFDEVEAEGADFASSRLDYVVFRVSGLRGASFKGALVSHCLVMECRAEDASWVRATGEAPCWLKSGVQRADFRYAAFERAHWLDVDATEAQLACADLPQCRFYRVVLRKAVLDRANLLRADLRKASVMHTSFRGANLYDAKLMETAGTDVDIRDATTTLANFKRSELVFRS